MNDQQELKPQKFVFLLCRPYTTLRPKKKHQVYVHVDHPYVGQKIQTTSNIPRDHQVSQVIEPVVNTITNAIKSTFKQRNEIGNVQLYFDFMTVLYTKWRFISM